MGYVAYDLVVATGFVADRVGATAPDVDTFRESLPEDFRPLVVGPFTSAVNGYQTWLFLPDGSKRGWDTDRDGDLYRQRFADLFLESNRQRRAYFDVVSLTYGNDHRGDFDQPQARYLDDGAEVAE